MQSSGIAKIESNMETTTLALDLESFVSAARFGRPADDYWLLPIRQVYIMCTHIGNDANRMAPTVSKRMTDVVQIGSRWAGFSSEHTIRINDMWIQICKIAAYVIHHDTSRYCGKYMARFTKINVISGNQSARQLLGVKMRYCYVNSWDYENVCKVIHQLFQLKDTMKQVGTWWLSMYWIQPSISMLVQDELA